MSNPWLREFWRIATLVVIALVIGLALDQTLASFTLGIIIYLAWHVYHLYRLEAWFSHADGRPPPDAEGIWGDVFYHVYKLQQRNKKRKKKLAAMLMRFQESTSAMPDATIVLNNQNEIEWLNKAAKHLLGLKTKQDIGQRIDNLLRASKFVRYLAQGDYSQAVEITSPVSRNIQLSINLVPYGKNKKLLIARDVTRITQLESMRRDFIANVSHELKTPITVIMGYLENFVEGGEKESNRWQSAFKQMQQQTWRLHSIVDDLLLLSRLETEDQVHIRAAVSVPAVLAAIREEASSLANERQQQILLECNNDLWLFGNEKELHSAISNLVFNAVKYTPNGGKITIRWYLSEGKACLEVVDTGIGIEPEHIPRLTERFYRVDTGRSREQGGTGLGLAIVKHVLMRHDADLSVTSEINKGSTFKCLFSAERVLLKSEEYDQAQAQSV